MTAFTLLRGVDLAIDVDFRVFKTSDIVPVSSTSSPTERVKLTSRSLFPGNKSE